MVGKTCGCAGRYLVQPAVKHAASRHVITLGNGLVVVVIVVNVHAQGLLDLHKPPARMSVKLNSTQHSASATLWLHAKSAAPLSTRCGWVSISESTVHVRPVAVQCALMPSEWQEAARLCMLGCCLIAPPAHPETGGLHHWVGGTCTTYHTHLLYPKSCPARHVWTTVHNTLQLMRHCQQRPVAETCCQNSSAQPGAVHMSSCSWAAPAGMQPCSCHSQEAPAQPLAHPYLACSECYITPPPQLHARPGPE